MKQNKQFEIQLNEDQAAHLLNILKIRFEQNMQRHKAMQWSKIQQKLEASPTKMWSLHEMERTGGEPDVVLHDHITDHYVFMDCSIESPSGRRSLCYDRKALDSRKAHKPENSVLDLASVMGVELLTEHDYYELQAIDSIDMKTSSWLFTPDDIRKKGGALFADKRYGRVFVYHNGAESYYASRGFRALVRV
ncbi:DUF4256 domain-containing protein [Acinetobacter terrae]|uniref:DUF4256 domain-containing protein n=1 Tax=Acinetobacter terrae TaxID=2731247 RepID=UPI0007D825C1|nr:DUF4256 domain-containing protein [Acinetobacter terrae]NNH16208.1 DUF4256 domain-containing protein [Acinetobacter terrae]OAL87800.1 hypothetical protein AY608_10825 [Acinetobacter terrae]